MSGVFRGVHFLLLPVIRGNYAGTCIYGVMFHLDASVFSTFRVVAWNLFCRREIFRVIGVLFCNISFCNCPLYELGNVNCSH